MVHRVKLPAEEYLRVEHNHK